MHAYPSVAATKVEKHAFYVSLLLILEPFISKHQSDFVLGGFYSFRGNLFDVTNKRTYLIWKKYKDGKEFIHALCSR